MAGAFTMERTKAGSGVVSIGHLTEENHSNDLPRPTGQQILEGLKTLRKNLPKIPDNQQNVVFEHIEKQLSLDSSLKDNP